jgi:hypothetical protein
MYKRFRGAYFRHQEGDNRPDDGDSMHHWNICLFLEGGHFHVLKNVYKGQFQRQHRPTNMDKNLIRSTIPNSIGSRWILWETNLVNCRRKRNLDLHVTKPNRVRM